MTKDDVDERAFELARIYREHAPFVARACRLFGTPMSAVDDVMHDVFIVVHRRLSDYDRDRDVRGWLYGIARNVVREHARRWRRTQGMESISPPLEDRQLGDPREPPGARTEALSLAASVLEVLSTPQREVFMLAEVEGFTAPDIAERLGVNVNTVYTRLRAARTRIGKVLESTPGLAETTGSEPPPEEGP